MAFNGSGLFVRLYNWMNDAANSINIRADRMDAEMDGFAAGLSNCITRDGQGKPSAAIDWNGQNLSNVNAGSFNTLSAATAMTVPDMADGDSSGNAANTKFATKAAATAASGVQTAVNSRAGDAGAIANRNRIINGNFSINQRGVSGTVTLAAGAYGHDRWKAGASGCTYTYATVGNDVQITITAGSLMQIIEGANVEGGVYTLNNGGGSAQMRASINGAATSGAYASGPITTASATAGQNITVEFTTGTVGKVQLEPGNTATPFERRPRGAELALCQYYMRPLLLAPYTFYQAAGNGYGLPIPLMPPMRATPTVTGGAFSTTNIIGTPAIGVQGPDMVGLGGGTANTSGACIVSQTATAFLSAEL